MMLSSSKALLQDALVLLLKVMLNPEVKFRVKGEIKKSYSVLP